MKEFIFIWNIENISFSWQKSGEAIRSPTFVASPFQNREFFCKFFPRGYEDSDYSSLYLEEDCFNENDINFKMNVKFYCLSADSTLLDSCIPKHIAGSYSQAIGEPYFIDRQEAFGRRKDLYLPQDTLTLCCRMWNDEGEAREVGKTFVRTCLPIEKFLTRLNIDIANSEEKDIDIQRNNSNEFLMRVRIVRFLDKVFVEIRRHHEYRGCYSNLKLSLVCKKSGRKLCEYESFAWFSENKKLQFPFPDKMLQSENDSSDGSDLEFATEFVYSTGEVNSVIQNYYSPRIAKVLSNYMIHYSPSGRLNDCPNLSKDLWNLYDKQILCDVELKTPRKSFFAHKIVLCARSSVFLKMLTSDMKEKRNNCIDIEDIADDMLEKFINFFYTDTFENHGWDTAVKLYYAADKYEVGRLKLLCSFYLMKNIDNEDKIYELLMLADRHQDCEIKRTVNALIWKNDAKTFGSPKWMKFADEKPQLALKTMLSKYEEKEIQSSAQTFDEKIIYHPNLQGDFKHLFQDKILSDLIIKTSGASFPTHKVVLCACSLMFREKLMQDLDDKPTDILEIRDLGDEIVSKMLQFLYTDSTVDEEWDTIVKLYSAADVYKIPRLKFICGVFFLENVKVSNVANILLFAHEHRDVNLKSAVENYICRHDEEIFPSKEWDAFCKANPELAFETMRLKYKTL